MRVEYAIRDYYRASEQRSKWAREELLVDGELQSYERELVEAASPRRADISKPRISLLQPSRRIDRRLPQSRSVVPA